MVDGNACARLETEPVSVAVHVRQMPDRTAAVALLDPRWLRADSSLTLKPGREVLELAVTDAGKGSALRRSIMGLGGAGALCLGYLVAGPAGALAVLTRLAELLP
jgi:trehalose 6-phosphate phosphatase